MVIQSSVDNRPVKRPDAAATARAGETLQRRSQSFPGRSVLAFIPVFAFFYVLLILPFLSGGGPRIENILFWPALAVCVLGITIANRSKLDRDFFRSSPIASFAVFMLFAAASITWALAPEYAFTRYALQSLTAIAIIVPYALPIDTSRTLQRLHLCALIAVIINGIYILTTPPTPIGHAGYFGHKQELGIFSGVAIILGAHALLSLTWRSFLGAATIALTVMVLIQAQSKAPFAFVFVSIAFGSFTVLVCKLLRTTPAFVVGGTVLSFIALSYVWSDPVQRIAWYLYGDPTLTGRTYIWEFIEAMISQNRWFGWGFHSYWEVPNSPHRFAPGFVKEMISTHSGYLEVRLDTGRIGYVLFLVFLYTSLHFLDPVRRVDPLRAWFNVTIVSYILLVNMLESVWLNTGPLWILFLIVVAETVHISLKTGAKAVASPAKSQGRQKRKAT